MSDASVTGWDLGGAHLKAAQIDGDGRILTAIQIPCRLWQGMHEFDRALTQALQRLAPSATHAVTMTGEMADLFATRGEGVVSLIDAIVARLSQGSVKIFAGPLGLLPPERAKAETEAVASANWFASAKLAAGLAPQGLFVDVGSTTTDVVPFHKGEVLARGYRDDERLAAEELVYTGVVRTPLMAVADRVPFGGERLAFMAEHFATTADVYRLTGELGEDLDQHPAADGGGKSAPDSARRIARMLGRDVHSAPLEDWRDLAHHLAELQKARIYEACVRVLSRGGIDASAPLIGAGGGRFLLPEVARRLRRPYEDLAGLIAADGSGREWSAVCAPAVAVAWLGRQDSASAPASAKARRRAASAAGSRSATRPRRPHSAPRKPR